MSVIEAATARMRGTALRRVGRGLVWLALAVVIARGLAAILIPQRSPVPPVAAPRTAGAWSPSPGMLWVAGAFARDWLSDSPASQARAARLEASTVDVALPTLGSGSWTVVATTSVAWQRTGASSARVTVDAQLRAGARVYDRFLVVPVGQDAAGVAVIGAPALGASPAVDARVPAAVDANLSSAPAAVTGLLERFLPAYLAGGDLIYLEAPGVDIAHPPSGLRLNSLQSVEQLSTRPGGVLEVRASVVVSDARTGDTYPLVYALAVRQLDRWVVTAINQ